MSRYIDSTPCRQQAKIMKALGFTALETDDSMMAVWQQGVLILQLPAAWEPEAYADVIRRIHATAYEQGAAAARQQIRAALNGHA